MNKVNPTKKILSIVLVLALVSYSLGCLGDEEPETGQSVRAGVWINFGNATVEFNPGNKTTWKNADGKWTWETEEAENKTLWVFEGVSTENATVLNFLNRVAEIGSFSVQTATFEDKVTVKSIAEVANGDQGNMWRYRLNGEVNATPPGSQNVKDGDLIEWEFMPPSGGDSENGGP